MIDFTLSPEQTAVREQTRAFAIAVLKNARQTYAKLSSPQERFQSTQPMYMNAVRLGLLKALIPAIVGGSGSDDMISSALAVEELYAIEPSVALTILTNGLGLGPLIRGASPEQHQEFLSPFLAGDGTPLAGIAFSEPGGSANYFEPEGMGIQTKAKKDGDNWIVNGEKIWATNCAGWDFKGADLQCLVCREDLPNSDDSKSSAMEDSTMLLLIPRKLVEQNSPEAYTVLRHLETPGHIACSSPHIKFTDFRVPSRNTLTHGRNAVNLINEAFTSSAVMVGAMSVGIMRAAFETALQFSKTRTAGGSMILLKRQSVADLLVDIKIRVESSRYLTWKAAHSLHHAKDGAELAYETKISCSEAAIKCVADAMKVVGISSYSIDYPLATLMSDALVLPIFDGGNVGMRRRQLQNLFLAEEYEPWLAAFGGSSSAV